jgi:hypothetical protein
MYKLGQKDIKVLYKNRLLTLPLPDEQGLCSCSQGEDSPLQVQGQVP